LREEKNFYHEKTRKDTKRHEKKRRGRIYHGVLRREEKRRIYHGVSRRSTENLKI